MLYDEDSWMGRMQISLRPWRKILNRGGFPQSGNKYSLSDICDSKSFQLILLLCFKAGMN